MDFMDDKVCDEHLSGTFLLSMMVERSLKELNVGVCVLSVFISLEGKYFHCTLYFALNSLFSFSARRFHTLRILIHSDYLSETLL